MLKPSYLAGLAIDTLMHATHILSIYTAIESITLCKGKRLHSSLLSVTVQCTPTGAVSAGGQCVLPLKKEYFTYFSLLENFYGQLPKSWMHSI